MPHCAELGSRDEYQREKPLSLQCLAQGREELSGLCQRHEELRRAASSLVICRALNKLIYRLH